MLLNLVDKHWTRERSLHHNNNFLCELGPVFGFALSVLDEPKIMNVVSLLLFSVKAQAVEILSMMENDICSREAEVRTLRRETDELKLHAAAREDEHKEEVGNLSAQLEEARCAVVSGNCNSNNLPCKTLFTLTGAWSSCPRCVYSNTGQNKWAAEDCLGGKCRSAETSDQIRTSASQVHDGNFTSFSD